MKKLEMKHIWHENDVQTKSLYENYVFVSSRYHYYDVDVH